MQIQSKKTGQVHNITKSQWENILKQGRKKSYSVLDDTDDKLESIEIPQDIKEEEIAELPPEDESALDLSQMSDDELRKELKEMGVHLHPNTGRRKLEIKYKEEIYGR